MVNESTNQPNDGFSISVMKRMKQGAALEGESHFFFLRQRCTTCWVGDRTLIYLF